MQPGLSLVTTAKKDLIIGQYAFNAVYNDVPIIDTYAIRAVLSKSDVQPPCVYEAGGRLRSVLDSHPELHDNLAELHCYTDGKLCLAAPQDIALNFMPQPSLALLFDQYVQPFLYSQAYFQQYGDWPWQHLPHDAAGILTWYEQNTTLPGAAKATVAALIGLDTERSRRARKRAVMIDSMNPRAPCLCGSGKTTMQCHRASLAIAYEFRRKR
jgi:hypothetical protein